MFKKRMGLLVFVLLLCTVLGATLLACDDDKQPSGFGVTFETDGGTAVAALEGVTEVAESPATSKTGYTFAGWYLSADLSGEAVTFPLAVTADTTLYAKWTANTYTVTFDYGMAQDGIGADEKDVAFGAALGELPAPTATGYTFAGWYDGDTLYTADSVMPAADLDLTAVFAANEYTLTFDTTVDGITVEDVTVTFAAAVPALPVPEREGWTFLGWWDADGDKFEAGATYITVGDTALTARWEQITFSFTVDVNYDGGADKSVTVPYGTTIGEALDETGAVLRDGYTLEGWYLNAECTETADKNAELTAETTVYAKWTANTYELTFAKYVLREGSPVLFEYGGEEYDFTVTVTYGQPVGELPGVEDGVYVPAGFTFTGWGWAVTSNTGEQGEPIDETYVWNFTDDTRLSLKPGYARNTYTLTLDAGEGAFRGGESTVTLDAEYYSSLSALLSGYTPAQENKTFGGWAYDGAPVGERYLWTEDVTLTAVWYGLPYTLTLDPDGGTMQGEAERTVNGGAELGALPTPEKEGYTFDGWWADETEYTADSLMPDSALTLTAKWAANTYTITFSSDGGGEFEAVEVKFGETVPALPVPEKEGSVFTGWLLGSVQVKEGDTYTWAFDITLVAGYEGEVAYTEGINYVFVPEADGVPAHFKVGNGTAKDAYEGDTLTHVVLRSEVEHTDGQMYPVTEIANAAFSGKTALVSVTLPDTLTTIGLAAFGQTGVKELVIPASVVTLNRAFMTMMSLEKLVFEEGSQITAFVLAQQIGNCRALKEIQLPSNLETLTIPSNTAAAFPALNHIYIPAAEGQKYVSNADGTQITDTSTGTVVWTSPVHTEQ